MDSESLWGLVRRPFVYPRDKRAVHKCIWEKIEFNKAGCRLCGDVHVCESTTCRDISVSDDNFICNITGCILKKVLSNDVWNDRCIGWGCQSSARGVSADANSVRHYISEILTSERAESCIVHEKLKITNLFNSKIAHSIEVAQGVAIDAIEITLSGISAHIPCDFVLHERNLLVLECLRFIEPVLGSFFNCNLFKCLKQNKRSIACAMLYLMKTGVFMQNRTVLPKLAKLHLMLPQECNLKQFFNINPSIITDTENKLKLMIRTCQVIVSN